MELLLALPWLFWSFCVVTTAATMLLDGFWAALVVALWILSGVLILWPPMEDYLARYLFRLRRPTMLEQQKLDVAWRAVCSRVNVDPQYYKLWVEESDSLNGAAMAGRSVAVTRWTLTALTPRQLQAILARELGHHQGGHPWAGLLAFWYSLPGRFVAALSRRFLRLISRVPIIGCLVAGAVVMGYIFSILLALWFNGNVYFPLATVLPFIVPIPLAWFARRSELNADLVAADLGYARELIALFYDLQSQGEDVARRAAGWRGALYSTHPSIAGRITALERHVQVSGR
jgi:Zn-dependent protease with chaperone function